MMNTSEQIGELAAALAKAQGEMGGAVKDSANPFFKSKYADLASVMDACRAPLAKHGLAIVQSPSSEGSRVSVETMLLHTSGQWIKGAASASAKDDGPQSIGSAITYLRRYALQSFAGVAPEDDDGEGATNRNGNGHAVSAPAVVAQTLPPVQGSRENASAPSAGDSSGHLGTLITKVDATSTKTGTPKWYVHFEDGNKAGTISAIVAAKAQHCHANRIRVQPELKKTQWGYDLMGLFEVSAGRASRPTEPEIQLRGDEHAQPVEADDIPF